MCVVVRSRVKSCAVLVGGGGDIYTTTAARQSHNKKASVAICEILFLFFVVKNKAQTQKADAQRSRTGNMYAHKNRREVGVELRTRGEKSVKF